MITLQKNELVVVLRNPEFKDADDYFATVKYKKDYDYNIHAVSDGTEKRMLTLNFKEVPKRYYDALSEFIVKYNHTQVQFIDWYNTGMLVAIRNNTLDGKADAFGEYYSFTLNLEVL